MAKDYGSTGHNSAGGGQGLNQVHGATAGYQGDLDEGAYENPGMEHNSHAYGGPGKAYKRAKKKMGKGTLIRETRDLGSGG